LITSRVGTGEAIEIFYRNMKVLLFEDEEYKGLIFKNYNIGKNLRAFIKKLNLKLIIIMFRG
jgi:hypothetical protein